MCEKRHTAQKTIPSSTTHYPTMFVERMRSARRRPVRLFQLSLSALSCRYPHAVLLALSMLFSPFER